MKSKTIGIGILSWKAHQTLIQSLESYQSNGFLEMFDQKIIYFSDLCDEDIEIAKKYSWDYAGGPNEGIAGGMKRLAECMHTDYILLLQNDNPIIEDARYSKALITKSLKLLENKICDMIRLRHRWVMGEPSADVNKYLDYYPAVNIDPSFIPEEHKETPERYPDNFKKKLLRLFRPIKTRRLVGRSIYIEQNPEVLYPKTIQKYDEFLIADSSVLNFSDQCIFISRDLWLGTFVPFVEKNPSKKRTPNGFQAPEICINGQWWRKSHFKVALCHGLFSNNRIDGSYRPEHWTNKK